MSRIIKSPWAVNDSEHKKIIEIKPLINPSLSMQEEKKPAVDQAAAQAIVQKANADAACIIQKANDHADLIRKEAEAAQRQWQEVERRILEEEAREVGYNEGYSMGKKQGYEEMQTEIQQVKRIVDLSKEDYHQYLESSEKTILDLAIHVAGKILNQEVKMNEGAFLSVVKKAIKEAREHREVRLLIHPLHYENLLSQKEELQAIFPKETDFYIFPDNEIEETSCIIESSNGRIDASIDRQLQEVKRKLLDILEGE
ncbi:MAG: flagellar assembly protein FliH [Bacillus sp. (in: firmicutes)]